MQTAEMANFSCGTEAHLHQINDHQSECEAIQFQESDKEVSINAPEQEAVSGPVVHQDGATKEPEEHSADIKNELQDQPDLEDPVRKLLGEMDEVENGTKATSSPEPQTSHQDHGYSNPYHHHSPDVNGNYVLVQEIEVNGTDQKTRNDHPGRKSDSVLEHLEEMRFISEMQLQAAEESETSEPPAKQRLRRRMGMCGLGDRKRKLPFDGQHCRQGHEGRPRQEEAGKGYNGVQYTYNTVLENEPDCCKLRKDHEGGTILACKENEETLKDKENNVTAVLVEESTSGVAERENRYALSNMSKCTTLMNELITNEPPVEKKDAAITMDNKTSAEQMVLEHKLSLLADISSEVGQTMFSPIIGEILNMIQEELSVAAAHSDHETDNVPCVHEPNILGAETTDHGQDNILNVKYEVLSGVEMSEDPVKVTKEVHEVPTELIESEMKLKEQSPTNITTTEKPEPNGAELSESMQNELGPLFADSMDNEVMDSFEIHYAKNNENEKPITAVLKSTEAAGGDRESAEVSPTGQEYHMQVCNPTLTPADNELLQETCVSLLYPVTDSQLHKIALSMELEDQPIPEGCDHQEDATELVHGLIRELSTLKYDRTVMAAHREMELLRRGKFPKVPSCRPCGPHHTEM